MFADGAEKPFSIVTLQSFAMASASTKTARDESDQNEPSKRLKVDPDTHLAIPNLSADKVDPNGFVDRNVRASLEQIDWDECSMLAEHIRLLCIANNLQDREQDLLQDFVRFFLLKLMFDGDARLDLLSPTPLMDAIWHHCILSTNFYMNHLCWLGHTAHCKTPFIHHRIPPQTPEEDAARLVRLQRMRTAYRLAFNDSPIEVPPVPDLKEEPCQIAVKHLSGRVDLIDASPSDTVFMLKMRVWHKTKIPPDQQILLDTTGEVKRLDDLHQVITRFGIGHHSRLSLVLHLGGC